MKNKKTAAVLACAGSGSRMKGSCGDKLLYDDRGMPVAAHALLAYDRAETVELLVVVTREELLPVYRAFREKYGFKKELIVTVGGSTRTESVLNGVRAVPAEYGFVAVGDGARPLIRPQEIDATVRAAWQSGAAALGVHLTDTVKEVAGERILRTVPREVLVGIQTPQVFAREKYLQLAERAASEGGSFTDDASIFEYYGEEVTFVEGRRDNMKITTPEDLALFRALMEEQQ